MSRIILNSQVVSLSVQSVIQEFNEIEDESHFLFNCSLYDELRSEWVSHIVNKRANFLELDKINKFKVIFDTHHRITVKIYFALLST